MATMVVLPAVRRSDVGPNRLEVFEAIEGRFAWYARIATVVVGTTGFYMTQPLELWERFRSGEFWWMHAMVCLWLLFTVLLFVAEPLVLRRRFHARASTAPDAAFALLQRAHWLLLVLSLITIRRRKPGSLLALTCRLRPIAQKIDDADIGGQEHDPGSSSDRQATGISVSNVLKGQQRADLHDPAGEMPRNGRVQRGTRRMATIFLAIVPVSVAVLKLITTGSLAEEPGESVFKKNCAICHTLEAGKNKIGPSLAGVVDRKAGSVPGFAYSAANKNSGDTWDVQTLDTYLTEPQKFMPGTKMVFAGLKNPEDRKALIEYLREHH